MQTAFYLLFGFIVGVGINIPYMLESERQRKQVAALLKEIHEKQANLVKSSNAIKRG